MTDYLHQARCNDAAIQLLAHWEGEAAQPPAAATAGGAEHSSTATELATAAAAADGWWEEAVAGCQGLLLHSVQAEAPRSAEALLAVASSVGRKSGNLRTQRYIGMAQFIALLSL